MLGRREFFLIETLQHTMMNDVKSGAGISMEATERLVGRCTVEEAMEAVTVEEVTVDEVEVGEPAVVEDTAVGEIGADTEAAVDKMTMGRAMVITT